MTKTKKKKLYAGKRYIGKLYTYKVIVTMEIDQTFREDELMPCLDGEENCFEPNQEALELLEQEIDECMLKIGGAYNITAESESTELLGISDDEEDEDKPKKQDIKKKKRKSP